MKTKLESVKQKIIKAVKEVDENNIILEDVLMALVYHRENGKHYYSFRTIAGYRVYTFQILNEGDENYMKEFDWELNKSLEEQSEETINFLNEIL